MTTSDSQDADGKNTIFGSVTRPCNNCNTMFPHAFLGSRCPSCKVINWKYQAYVIPAFILAGLIVAAAAVLLVFSKL